MREADKYLAFFLAYMLREVAKIAGIKVEKMRPIPGWHPDTQRIYGQAWLDEHIIEICMRNSDGTFYHVATYLDTIIHEVAHLVTWDKHKSEKHGWRFRNIYKDLKRKVYREIRLTGQVDLDAVGLKTLENIKLLETTADNG